MLDNIATFAETLADAAGKIARGTFHAPGRISQKADRSFVTETDRTIENALKEMILAQYPAHGIFGEEHGRINPGASMQWVIDPIDGTNAFIAGIPTFTTLIALVENNVPILGIIDQPVLNERWASHKVNARPATTLTLAEVIIATTSMRHFSDAQMRKFTKLRDQCGGSVHAGDAYLYGKVATGEIGVAIDADLKPYDFCALRPVVEASGGVITDWAGKPITLDSDGTVLAAANAELHAAALAQLR